MDEAGREMIYGVTAEEAAGMEVTDAGKATREKVTSH